MAMVMDSNGYWTWENPARRKDARALAKGLRNLRAPGAAIGQRLLGPLGAAWPSELDTNKESFIPSNSMGPWPLTPSQMLQEEGGYSSPLGSAPPGLLGDTYQQNVLDTPTRQKIDADMRVINANLMSEYPSIADRSLAQRFDPNDRLWGLTEGQKRMEARSLLGLPPDYPDEIIRQEQRKIDDAYTDANRVYSDRVQKRDAWPLTGPLDQYRYEQNMPMQEINPSALEPYKLYEDRMPEIWKNRDEEQYNQFLNVQFTPTPTTQFRGGLADMEPHAQVTDTDPVGSPGDVLGNALYGLASRSARNLGLPLVRNVPETTENLRSLMDAANEYRYGTDSPYAETGVIPSGHFGSTLPIIGKQYINEQRLNSGLPSGQITQEVDWPNLQTKVSATDLFEYNPINPGHRIAENLMPDDYVSKAVGKLGDKFIQAVHSPFMQVREGYVPFTDKQLMGIASAGKPYIPDQNVSAFDYVAEYEEKKAAAIEAERVAQAVAEAAKAEQARAAARAAQSQRAKEQAVVTRNQPDRGLQQAQAQVAEAQRVADIVTRASTVPVDPGLKKTSAPKKAPKITRPVLTPDRKPHVPNIVWVGGLNGGPVDLNNPSMGNIAGPDRWGGGPGDFRGGLASGEGAYGMNPNY